MLSQRILESLSHVNTSLTNNAGEKVEIFNQVAETLKVRDLATLIAGKTGVEIRNLENPRKEDAENELQVCIVMVLWYAV